MVIKPVKMKIRQLSSYLPEEIIDNDNIMKQMGLAQSGNLLYRTVGAKEKRVAKTTEMGSDMMAKVGRKILEESNIEPASIDKLICSCDPPDHSAPDSSVVTQVKIGLKCPAFGVSMSCVGWICGLNIASGFFAQGDNRILVLSASTVGSKFFFKNPMHRAIFGDGAGGALLERAESEEEAQILRIDLMALGQFYKDIFAPNPWTDVPDEIPTLYKNAFYMAPDNQIFFDALDRYIKPFYQKQLDITGLLDTDISLFIVHQASMPLFNHTIDSFGIPRDKVVDRFSSYGNTISAELPIYLDEVVRSGRVEKGEYVYLLTYGAGFTAGATILRL